MKVSGSAISQAIFFIVSFANLSRSGDFDVFNFSRILNTSIIEKSESLEGKVVSGGLSVFRNYWFWLNKNRSTSLIMQEQCRNNAQGEGYFVGRGEFKKSKDWQIIPKIKNSG